MNTLEELKYYCEENQPVGAMLLTGEWGCGKTYLIDHDLKETLKDTHIIIRVSLFGVNSIDELKSDVKKEWIAFSGTTADGVSLDNFATVQERRFSSREEKEQDEQRRSSILKRRPHNIRSIKCALQYFERVYDRMSKEQINCNENWLCSYLAYVMAFRAALLEENERYGTLLSEGNLSILYPGFYNSKYILESVIRWIRTGEWYLEDIDAEIKYVIDRDKAMEPKDIVRTNRIIDIDEEVIKKGFPEIL